PQKDTFVAPMKLVQMCHLESPTGTAPMRRALLLILCCLESTAHAAGDAAKGKALFASCAACHGASAEGNAAINAPALGGQDAAYLQRELSNFPPGARAAAQS